MKTAPSAGGVEGGAAWGGPPYPRGHEDGALLVAQDSGGGPGLDSWLNVRPELEAQVRDDDPAPSPVPAWRRPEKGG